MADKKIGPKQIKTVSEKTDDFLSKSSKRAQKRMEYAIQNLENSILDTLRKIEVNKNGRIEGLKVNLKQSQAIHKKLIVEFEKTYNRSARSTVDGFDGISKLIEDSWEYLGESANYTTVEKDMIFALKESSFQQFEQFGRNAQTRIVDSMYSHVVGGAEYKSLLNTVTGILTGHKDIGGRPMLRYVEQYSFDSVMNFHNQVNLAKSEDLGIFHYLYVGDIMGSTRKFCRRRAGKVYTKGQINSWNTLQWQGKAGPPFQFRGGYNCRHHWRPVRPEWLDGKTQLEVGNWDVGENKQQKPKYYRNLKNARGWNEYTRDERYNILKVQDKIKSGQTISSNSKFYKFWFDGLNEKERKSFINSFKKQGFEIPNWLRD